MDDKIKTAWDLSGLLASDDDPRADDLIKQAQEAYQKFVNEWESRTDYLAEPTVLKEALDDYESLAKDFDGVGSVGYYFYLRYHQNQTDPKIKSKNNSIYELEVKLANSVEFFTNRLAKISAENQKVMLASPLLESYRHFLEKLFESAKYVLTEPEEKILNLKNATSFGNWVRMVREFISKEVRQVIDEDGQPVQKTFTELLELIDSKNKEVRDTSAKAINEVFDKHVDSAEHELNNILLDKKLTDELRGILRPDLPRHIDDDIDTDVVDKLIETVASRFDLAHRYYALKAKLLGVEKLAYHERNLTLGALNQKYPFSRVVDVVGGAFDELDPEFGEIFRSMIQAGQVDVYPAKGKYGGAFCVHKRLKDPTYILLNHTDRLNDVLTLGHEMGHAINNVLIARAQNALNNDTPLSTAEVASTFMEDFVFARAQQDYTTADRLYLIMEKLNDDISSIFRQVACYQFEQDLHKSYREKSYLTKEEIGALFTKHMSAYMGDAVEQSPGSQNWWVYWSHIRSFFYVYSYASGQLISKALQNMVRQDKTAITQVKKFLSAGLSKSPKELFLDMGIDITDRNFWNKGLDEVEQLLSQAESLAGQQQPSN